MRLPSFPEVQQSEHVIVFGVIECSFCFTRTLAELCRAGEDELSGRQTWTIQCKVCGRGAEHRLVRVAPPLLASLVSSMVH